jgi:biopolymer transport protein ExbD/biopolymer transport protein TolR
MGMAGGGGSSGLTSEINVTPMVDIMLVLLIIFMVVTPMLQHGVTVSLPTDLANPEEDAGIIKEGAIVISIPKDDEFYLGKIKVVLTKSPSGDRCVADTMANCSELQRSVKTMLDNIKEDKDRIVYIKSGIGVQYGQVVDVIDQVRDLGIDKIGLVADKKKGGAPAPAPAS